jgi:tetratricopeptide (TPR) repeat protein
MRWGLLASALFLITADIHGQSLPLPGSVPSYSDLIVRVRLTNERPPEASLEVEVVNDSGIALLETFTHDEGRADFLSVPMGRYRIRVTGTGYEPTLSEVFEIIHNEHSHTEYVYVRPKTSSPDAGGPPVISAYDLNVPEKAKTLLDKGMEAYSAGDKNAALDKIRKAIKVYPQYVQAYNNLGVVLISMDDRQGAQVAFEKALKLNDRFAPAYVNLARLMLRDHDLPKAGALLEKALASDPSNLEGLSVEANVQFLQGDFAKALETVNKVHTLPHEHFADVHLVAAEIYQKQGHNQDALRECQLFLHEAPGSPRAAQVKQSMAVIQARNSH